MTVTKRFCSISFCAFVVGALCGVSGRADSNVTSRAAWWESIIHDGTNTVVAPHDPFAAAASYGPATPTGWAGNVARGIYLFNSPFLIRQDFPGFNVLSATLTVSLDFYDTNDGTYLFHSPPGVHAYQVEVADHTTAFTISAGDYWAPELRDLGKIVPPTAGTPANGDYTIDITSALRIAVANTNWGEAFGVRLHYGDETDGQTIDENLYFGYFFKYTATPQPPPDTENPRIDVVLTTNDVGAVFTEVSVTDTVALLFQSQSNINYQVQVSTNPPSGVWTDLDYLLFGTGSQMLAFDPSGITTAKTYRILER